MLSGSAAPNGQAGAAALGAAPPETIRGLVEQLDEQRGVAGWAVDPARPDQPVEVELWAGGIRLATGRTGLERDDVSAALGISGAPGFVFGEEAAEGLRLAAASGRRGAVEVRVAGHAQPLPSAAAPLELGFIQLAREPAGRGRDVDFLARLADLRAQAAHGLQRALRPAANNRAGFIEVVSVDEGGLIWVLGWMRNDARFDRPAVVLDGSKIPAGFAYVMIPRADLPENAVGLIGVLHTDWRPSRGSKAFLFINEKDTLYLEGLDPIDMVSKATLVQHCAPLWAMAGLGYAPEIRRLMQQVRSWEPLPPEFAPEIAAVEEVLVLPGFGCFATGWALSPTRHVDRLVLKLGSALLVSEAGATMTKPRPDLAHVFPGADRLVGHAGFTAVFPGDVDADALSEAVLKIVYRDGTSSNHAIAPASLRRLGEAASWERVRQFYPSIAAEPFFPAFADAVAAHYRALADDVRPLVLQPCAEAILFALPPDRSDAFLLFEGIARAERGLPPGTGIVLLAGQDDERTAAIALFDDLRRATDRPLSLMLVPEAAMAAYSLPRIARLVGLDRFLFVGSSAMLAPAGWRAAAALDGALAFLDVADPAREDGGAEPGFDCFAWSVFEFHQWLAQARPLIGGPGMAPPPPALLAQAVRVPGGAQRTRIASPGPLIDAINRGGTGR